MIIIKIEILLASYLEHFKAAKDLALIYPIDNPKRIKIEQELNNIQMEINLLNEKNKV